MAGRIGAYPGTFDPPTVAHLAVAEAAWRQGGLMRVDLVVSRRPLGKTPAVPTFEDRLAVLRAVASSRPWLGVEVTSGRLIADVCRGYDAVVMGLDKWHQVMDPAWYGDSPAARDAAVASLPPLLLALRAGFPHPSLPPGGTVLVVDEEHLTVSSTMARAGRLEWMAPEAARFDTATGAWSDPERYAREARSAGTDGAAATKFSPMPAPTELPEE